MPGPERPAKQRVHQSSATVSSGKSCRRPEDFATFVAEGQTAMLGEQHYLFRETLIPP